MILEEKKKLSVVARNDEVAKERLRTEKKYQKPHYEPLEFEARYGKWFKDYHIVELEKKEESCGSWITTVVNTYSRSSVTEKQF